MQIAGLQSFKSIPAFDPIDLPNFTILTGINGSGKSQLLDALESQIVRSDIFGPLQSVSSLMSPMPPGSNPGIVKLANQHVGGDTFSAITPSAIAHRYGGQSPRTPGMSPHYNFDQLKRQYLHTHQADLQKVLGPIFEKIVSEHGDIWALGEEKLLDLCGIAPEAPERAYVHNIFAQADSSLIDRPTTHDPSASMFQADIRTAMEETGIRATAFDADMAAGLRRRTTSTMFFPNVAEIISQYRDAQHSNDMDQVQANRGGENTFLQPDEFVKKYGRPPWEIMSDLLIAMGLPFKVAAPSIQMDQPCSFILKEVAKGHTVNFNSLSSGEQVLVRFAMSIIRPHPYLLGVQRPQLLLLDEMDASLHPEMVQRWLNAITKGIVGELGICTILTTHSPTTVALAPEESIFEMQGGIPVKVTKQEALNHLTFGVPTLSINYSGRRQVFVESNTDAQSYETIYAAVKSHLKLSKELNFISTGMKAKDGGEINSGVTIVRSIVKSLSETGNDTVYGIIDWDGEAQSDSRIRVMGEGYYYTLENILLDPLLLGALLIMERVPIAGIPVGARGLDALTAVQLQQLADAIQNSIEMPDDDGSFMTVRYLGGAELQVKKRYMSMNGHQLEDLLITPFPFLRKYTSNRGALNQRVAKVVITDFPEFCPKAISQVFETISCVS